MINYMWLSLTLWLLGMVVVWDWLFDEIQGSSELKANERKPVAILASILWPLVTLGAILTTMYKVLTKDDNKR